MNWRLTSEVVAYVVPDTKEIYLAGAEKKQYQVNVIKLIGEKTYQEVRLYENQFDLKFGEGDGFNLYLKCSELPDNWFLVSNFRKQEIWSLMEGHTIVDGVIQCEKKFEVILKEGLSEVSFIEPGMKEFNKCFEEMKRKMNCEMCKKTTKWVLGHRYDSFTESIFPLAKVKIRKSSLTNSGLIKNPEEMPEVILYVNELKGEKTISEVLKNRSFGDKPADLKVTYGTKSMVDSGEALVNDYSGEIKDYWLPIYDNAKETKKSLKEILDIFSVISNPEVTISLPTSEIEDLILEDMNKVIINFWNSGNTRADISIGDKNTEEENLERLKKLFLAEGIIDTNFLKTLYYPDLFNELGINLNEVSSKALMNIREVRLNQDNFDLYLKYLDYWKNPVRIDKNRYMSKQRIKSTDYKLEVVTIKDLYGNTELTKTLIEMTNDIRNNFGLGATEYSLINIGTKKAPKEYVICKITLSDIIKFKKGVINMSENLKDEILKNHFVWLQVVFDKDGTIN